MATTKLSQFTRYSGYVVQVKNKYQVSNPVKLKGIVQITWVIVAWFPDEQDAVDFADKYVERFAITTPEMRVVEVRRLREVDRAGNEVA